MDYNEKDRGAHLGLLSIVHGLSNQSNFPVIVAIFSSLIATVIWISREQAIVQLKKVWQRIFVAGPTRLFSPTLLSKKASLPLQSSR